MSFRLEELRTNAIFKRRGGFYLFTPHDLGLDLIPAQFIVIDPDEDMGSRVQFK
jgi:hypothetical protein